MNFPLFSQSPDANACPKSTGVFQDEELLFSHKLQKDNDPDVDLFSGTKKTRVSSKWFSMSQLCYYVKYCLCSSPDSLCTLFLFWILNLSFFYSSCQSQVLGACLGMMKMMIFSALPSRILWYQTFVLNTAVCGKASGKGNECPLM